MLQKMLKFADYVVAVLDCKIMPFSKNYANTIRLVEDL